MDKGVKSVKLEEAIKIHQNASARIFTEWGVYIGDGYGLSFNREDYNKHFGYGCYLPDEKDWLLENAEVVFIDFNKAKSKGVKI